MGTVRVLQVYVLNQTDLKQNIHFSCFFMKAPADKSHGELVGVLEQDY